MLLVPYIEDFKAKSRGRKTGENKGEKGRIWG